MPRALSKHSLGGKAPLATGEKDDDEGGGDGDDDDDDHDDNILDLVENIDKASKKEALGQGNFRKRWNLQKLLGLLFYIVLASKNAFVYGSDKI